MPAFPAAAVSKNPWCVFFLFAHQAVETGKSPASRAALSLFESVATDDDPAKTSRGNEGG
jgi:hypothetical protein